MSATLKTLPLLVRIVLVVGLFFGVVSSQPGLAQPPTDACVMSAGSAASESAAMVSCEHCCAAKPCCLTSKPASDAPPHPEPLGNERSHQVDHASIVVTFTLVSTFDFLAPPQEPKARTGGRVVPPVYDHAPRGAVSCIWLI